MRPGEIVVEGLSRRFRVYPKPVRTLKELVVARGRVRGEDVWRCKRCRFASSPARRSASSGATAPASRHCCACSRASSGRRRARSRWAAGSRHRRHGELGWDGAAGDRLLRFDAERVPLAEGRFYLRFGLTDTAGERTYHRLDEALRFLVYPGGEVRGPVLLEGSWRMVSDEAELGAR